DEKFPLFWVHNAMPVVGWADAIQPYVKSVQLYQCPSEPIGPNSDPTSTGYTDYSYNIMLSSDVGGNFNDGRKLAELTKPSVTVMNLDDYSYKGNSWNWGCKIGTACTVPGLATLDSSVSTRHVDGQNFSFCDGH